MMHGRPRNAVRIGALGSVAAAMSEGQPVAASPPGRVAQRTYAGELRALVEGVELVGQLPAARGIVRHRLRLLLSSGAPLPANLNQSPDAGVWISIEAPGIAQAIADRLAEAALLRLRASNSGLLPATSR